MQLRLSNMSPKNACWLASSRGKVLQDPASAQPHCLAGGTVYGCLNGLEISS